MKSLRTVCLLCAMALCLAGRAQANYYTTPSGDDLPYITLITGDAARLKDTKQVNIIYDYSHMHVGPTETEAEYISRRTEAYRQKDPAKAERFAQDWVDARAGRYEPKFELLFNKVGKKVGVLGINNAVSGNVTLKVETYVTEPGFHAGIGKMPAFINARCTFYDSDNNIIVQYFIKYARGSQAAGFDYDSGSRIAESYAKAAKMLMTEVVDAIRSSK